MTSINVSNVLMRDISMSCVAMGVSVVIVSCISVCHIFMDNIRMLVIGMVPMSYVIEGNIRMWCISVGIRVHITMSLVLMSSTTVTMPYVLVVSVTADSVDVGIVRVRIGVCIPMRDLVSMISKWNVGKSVVSVVRMNYVRMSNVAVCIVRMINVRNVSVPLIDETNITMCPI
jgi:hypothetical protein